MASRNRYDETETLIRTSVSFPRELYAAAKTAAQARGLSVSELMVEVLRGEPSVVALEAQLKAILK